MRIENPTLSALQGQSRAGKDGTLVSELSATFGKMLDEVNRLQLESDHKIEEFATSPEKDIHGTMIALQKADISLRLLLQVRSRLTAAYQDIVRMQI
ncbi:MAG: flagellar hook-basal body complex protein FliE [Candidatus Lambdaproteobacteria bacterium]|nr:flagellar hook-basal body complex protein FliE [Candidatus Lambdaproteobacteria bacterium]